jgi:DNA replication protein DnaC
MKSSPRFIKRAEEELERRRGKALDTQKRRRTRAYEKVPALKQLDEELAQTGVLLGSTLGKAPDEAQATLALLKRANDTAQSERRRILAGAGFPKDYLDAPYECPICRDTGFANGLRCACFTRLVTQLTLNDFCMDAPLMQSTFPLFRLDLFPAHSIGGESPLAHMTKVKAYCTQYAQHFNEKSDNILFFGETGLGKTHLSLAIAGEVLRQGTPVLYGSAQNLLRRLEEERFSYDGTNETQEALLCSPLLILDDLGAEFHTKFTVAAIYNVVNTRLNKHLPTILSTNLDPEGLEAQYGARVASRIIGDYMILRCVGHDLRQTRKAEK